MKDKIKHLLIPEMEKDRFSRLARENRMNLTDFFRSVCTYFETTGINPNNYRIPESELIKKNRDTFVSFFRENEKKQDKKLKEIEGKLDEVLSFFDREIVEKSKDIDTQNITKEVQEKEEMQPKTSALNRADIDRFLNAFTLHTLLPKFLIKVEDWKNWKPFIEDEISRDSEFSFVLGHFFKDIIEFDKDPNFYCLTKDQYNAMKKGIEDM